MPSFSQRSINNLIGVHPLLVRVLTEAIKTTPIDFVIVEGLRSLARQQEIYAQGRARPGIIVTMKDGIRKKSNHQAKTDGFGYAVDLYPFENGKVQLNNNASLSSIARHIKKTAAIMGIAIRWGGDWKKPYDPPHFELVG